MTHHVSYGAQHNLTYTSFWDCASIGIVGPFLPRPRSGRACIVVVVENFSNKRWPFATPNQTVVTVAALPGGLFAEYGAPARLLADRGSNSLSDILTELVRSESGGRAITSSYHQQTDNKNENSHKLILAQMRSFATGNARDWCVLFRYFGAAYNNAQIEGAPFSPSVIFRG